MGQAQLYMRGIEIITTYDKYSKNSNEFVNIC